MNESEHLPAHKPDEVAELRNAISAWAEKLKESAMLEGDTDSGKELVALYEKKRIAKMINDIDEDEYPMQTLSN